MKKFLFLALFSAGIFWAHAQVVGNFERTDEGYVYFVLENNTYETFYMTWTAKNRFKYDTKTQSMTMHPGEVVYFGPEQINWIWESGETFTMRRLVGEALTWTCPYTDSRVTSQYNQNTVVVPVPVYQPAPRPTYRPAPPRPQPHAPAPPKPQQRPPHRRGLFF